MEPHELTVCECNSSMPCADTCVHTAVLLNLGECTVPLNLVPAKPKGGTCTVPLRNLQQKQLVHVSVGFVKFQF